MNSTQEKQVAMHTDFFDRCRFAIDNGFYLITLQNRPTLNSIRMSFFPIFLFLFMRQSV